MSHGNARIKVGMFATASGQRGRVVAIDHIDTVWKGRNIKSPTVDLSTDDGLLVGIPVRNLD